MNTRQFRPYALTVAAVLLSSSVFAQEGRVILIAKDVRVLPDGRVAVMLQSGDTISVKPTDVDLKMMQALVKPSPAPQTATESRLDELPTADNAMPGIRSKCAKEWPTDFTMQQYCQTQQREAVLSLWRRDMLNDDSKHTIRTKCAGEWPDDFSMRNYCEDQQLKALSAIK